MHVGMDFDRILAHVLVEGILASIFVAKVAPKEDPTSIKTMMIHEKKYSKLSF